MSRVSGGPTTASSTLARLVALVPYLQGRQGIELEQAAADLGVTPQQLVSDLNTVMMCGPHWQGGSLVHVDLMALESGHVHLENASFLAAPVRLNASEVVPLVAGLRLVRDVAGEALVDRVDALVDALLDRAAGAEAVNRVHVAVSGGPREVRGRLDEAIAAGRRVRFTHTSTTRGSLVREADPVGVFARAGAAYLRAWAWPTDGTEAGWRTFRLDRIADVTVLEAPVADHGAPADAPRAAADTWWDALGAGEAAEVTLTLDARAAWVAEYHPVQVVRSDPDEIVVRVRVADERWLERLLLGLGDRVRAVDPPRAAEAAVAGARAALDLYG